MFHVILSEGVTPAQVALRWVMQSKGITVPVIGARVGVSFPCGSPCLNIPCQTIEQLMENLRAAKFQLSDAHMRTLNEVSSKPLPHPFNLQA